MPICQHCFYFVPSPPGYSWDGSCSRHPPMASTDDGSSSYNNDAHRPKTLLGGYCGEWSASRTNSRGHISGAGTTNLVAGLGTLERVVVNTAGIGSITIYDSLVGSGAVISVITLAKDGPPETLEYNCDFTTGLTIAVVGALDITVVYR